MSDMRKPTPGWLTLQEAGKRLSVAEASVKKDLDDRRLVGHDRGTGTRPRWLVEEASVNRVIIEGGRADGRSSRARRIIAPANDDEERQVLTSRAKDLEVRLADAVNELAITRAEVARLMLVARNANMAVQAQTASLQQYLINDHVGQGGSHP